MSKNSLPEPSSQPLVSRRLTGCGYIAAVFVFLLAGLKLVGDIRAAVAPARPATTVAVATDAVMRATPAIEVTIFAVTDVAALVSPSSTPMPLPADVPAAGRVVTPAPVGVGTPASVQPPPPAPPPARGGETGGPAMSAPEAGGGVLPGLRPADVTVNLERKGFECAPAELSATGDYYIWNCKNSQPALNVEMIAEVWGRTLASVDLIDTTVMDLSGDDTLAKSVLGFIATMPYDGAEPERARAWVGEMIDTISGAGDVREMTIAGVPFRAYGASTGMAYVLEVGSTVDVDGVLGPLVAATSAPAVVAKSGRVQVAGGNPSVNIRAEPSTEAAKVGQLVAGETAEQVGALADGSWVQVKAGGVTGWIRADLVEPAAEAGAAAVAVVPAVETPAVVDVATSAPVMPLVSSGQVASANPTGKDAQGINVVDPPWLPCREGQIKGSKNLKYHVPGGRYYARTFSEVLCFNSEAEAQAAKFVRAMNQ